MQTAGDQRTAYALEQLNPPLLRAEWTDTGRASEKERNQKKEADAESRRPRSRFSMIEMARDWIPYSSPSSLQTVDVMAGAYARGG